MGRKKEADSRSTHERQTEFLLAYADTFSIERAAEIAKVDRTAHYRWFRRNPKYAAAFKKQKKAAGHYLKTEAITRAGEGWMEPVYYQGNVCGEVRRFDSGLMQFLLRGMMPKKYGSRTELSGPGGGAIESKLEVVFVNAATRES